MRIMLLGAGGFIGRHIMATLLNAGHDVIGVVRDIGSLSAAFPQASFINIDLARALQPNNWRIHLTNIDIIVNAAGLLRGREMDAVHVDMPRALYKAAEAASVRRVILISAISARPDIATDYAQSKLIGESVLQSTTLEWFILRPSLVYGDGSYGGTSLIRGMAGLPFFIPLPGNGKFEVSPLHVSDLAKSVKMICEDDRFERQIMEPVGPETLDLRTLLTRYRAWLGFGRARYWSLPLPVMYIMARIGDVAGNGPVSTNSLTQMIAGNAGDSTGFTRAIGFAPRSLNNALDERPAQVQDRWHARLFFLAPALKAMLIAMWLISAWLGLFYGAPQTVALLSHLGLPLELADPLRIGSSIFDMVIAGCIFIDRRAKWSTILQLVTVLIYTIVIGIGLPQSWLDPLGPLLKNFPIMLAIAIYGIIGNNR